MEELLFQGAASDLYPQNSDFGGLWREPVGEQLCGRTGTPATQGAAGASEKCFSVFSEEWQGVCLALHKTRSFSEDFTAIYFR